MHVLLAVASAEARTRIAALLERAGHSVAHAPDQATAAALGLSAAFDLLVVDSAFDAVGPLRLARPDVSILVVTEPSDVDARVLGLEDGADDAVGTDVAHTQLVARVGALERRAARAPKLPERIVADGCDIDLGALTASRGPTAIQLSAREAGVIRWLYANRARVVGRAELLKAVWGLPGELETRTVDVAISTLRKKIERDPARPTTVVTVKGAGYRWGQ